MLRRAESFNVGAPRNLAAPFQSKGAGVKAANAQPLPAKNDFVDYTNFQFPPLMEESQITFEEV